MTQAELFRGAHLTLREAAEACGVSHSTIKRRQREFEHAYQDQTGSWRVPVSDLLGAGLKLRPSAVEPVAQGHAPGESHPDLAQLRVQNEALKAELADERAGRMLAESKAAAEARIADVYARNLDVVQQALRAISGPPQPQEGTQDHTPDAPAPTVANATVEPEHVPRRAAPPRRGFRAWLRGG